MNNHTKLTAIVTSTLLLGAGMAPSSAAEPTDKNPTTVSIPEVAPVTAKKDVRLDFEKTAVATTPAAVATPAPVAEPLPVVEAPVAEAPETAFVEPAVVAAPAPKVATPAPTPAQTSAPVVAAPAPKPAPAPVAPSASGKGAAIASAALSQLGVAQDCTALATNSLAAVGIHFHDWPAGYLSLGHTVSAAEAQRGDLIYYANGGMGLAHIAVYIGNGQAVHGGWNGGTTAIFSANVGSGPIFIRVH
ncbi:endolysin, protease domain [Arthrobacter phage Atuin]|nr:endolysin, protease domain [Arthrobacter phage Atuin]